jgi:hypothetical protein
MFGSDRSPDASATEPRYTGRIREMSRRIERAELLNRLCDLRDAYQRRGPDDREAAITLESLLDHLARIWDHAEVAPEPNA